MSELEEHNNLSAQELHFMEGETEALGGMPSG